MAKKNDSKMKKEYESVVNWLERVWIVLLSYMSNPDSEGMKKHRRLSKIDPPLKQSGEYLDFGDWLGMASLESKNQEESLEELTFLKEIIKFCGFKPLSGPYMKLNDKNRDLIDKFVKETESIIPILTKSKTFLDVVTGKNDSKYDDIHKWYESWVQKHIRQLIRRQEGDEPPVIE